MPRALRHGMHALHRLDADGADALEEGDDLLFVVGEAAVWASLNQHHFAGTSNASPSVMNWTSSHGGVGESAALMETGAQPDGIT